MLMVHSINPWEVHPVVLDRDHDIWTHGMVSPISMLFGTPLLVLRKIHPDDEETLTSKDREEWDNQVCRLVNSGGSPRSTPRVTSASFL